jgi:hypothetical protein
VRPARHRLHSTGDPGSSPTDRGKRGTKYHVAADGGGLPVACAATAVNVNDTLAFERLFLAAFAVMARDTSLGEKNAAGLGSPAAQVNGLGGNRGTGRSTGAAYKPD